MVVGEQREFPLLFHHRRRLLFLPLPPLQFLPSRFRHKYRILRHLNLSLFRELLLNFDLFETTHFIVNFLLFRTPQFLCHFLV